MIRSHSRRLAAVRRIQQPLLIVSQKERHGRGACRLHAPDVTALSLTIPFLLVYGMSYFFTEFGPNMTTFVMPSELYPVSMRATGHGISAGVGKLGAFIGVFLFPVLQTSLGLRGTLLLTAGVSVLGFALTLVLPEPARRSLDDICGRDDVAPAGRLVLAKADG